MHAHELFYLLSDRTRLLVLELLQRTGELSVGEIAHELGVKEPSASQHLKALRSARLVRGTRKGRRVVYSLDPQHRGILKDLVAELPGLKTRDPLRLSARNRLAGTVIAVKKDVVTSAVTIDIGGQTVHSVITTAALDDLGLEVGDRAYAVVKATEVMVMR